MFLLHVAIQLGIANIPIMSMVSGTISNFTSLHQTAQHPPSAMFQLSTLIAAAIRLLSINHVNWYDSIIIYYHVDESNSKYGVKQ